jgi:hypothetical protein
LFFCRNYVPAKGIPGKVPLKKRNLERNPFFLQELGSNSPEVLELESQKKGMQKGMHNLVPIFCMGSTTFLF